MTCYVPPGRSVPTRPVVTPGPGPSPRNLLIEQIPYQPRPPDPLPIPIIDPALIPPAVITKAWSSHEAYWWATMARASYNPDDQWIRRAIFARGAYRRFGRFFPQPTDRAYGVTWCEMADRFVVVVAGTQNDRQLQEYVLSHGIGLQYLVAGVWFNVTWAGSGIGAATMILADWTAAGSKPTLVVGHSGGAPSGAAMLTQLRSAAFVQYDRIATFGAPRWATNSFNTARANLQVIDFANAGDPVSRIPPPRRLVDAIMPGGTVGGYPGGDYLVPWERLEPRDANGVNPAGEMLPPDLDLAVTVVNFLAGRLSLNEHAMARYASQMGAWSRADPVRPTVADFRLYSDLDTINFLLGLGGY